MGSDNKSRRSKVSRKSKRDEEEKLPPIAAEESRASRRSKKSEQEVVPIVSQATDPRVREDVEKIAGGVRRREMKLVGQEWVSHQYAEPTQTAHMAEEEPAEEEEEAKMAEQEDAAVADEDAAVADAAPAGPQKGGGFGNAAYGNMPPGPVEVPYGQPYSLEEQTKIVLQAVLDGLKEVVTNMVEGQNACEDRDEIDPFCFKLQQQAQKNCGGLPEGRRVCGRSASSPQPDSGFVRYHPRLRARDDDCRSQTGDQHPPRSAHRDQGRSSGLRIGCG